MSHQKTDVEKKCATRRPRYTKKKKWDCAPIVWEKHLEIEPDLRFMLELESAVLKRVKEPRQSEMFWPNNATPIVKACLMRQTAYWGSLMFASEGEKKLLYYPYAI